MKIISNLFILLNLIIILPCNASWESLIDAKYKRYKPELYSNLKEARNLIDKWKGEREYLVEAKNILDEVVAKDRQFAPAYFEYGRLSLKIGNTTDKNFIPSFLNFAEMSVLNAIEIEPDYAKAYSLLAHIYIIRNQLEKAKENLDKAESLGTHYPWLITNWGELYEKQKDFDSALTIYLRVVDDPQYDRRVYAFALKRISDIYKHKKDYVEADKWYRKAIEFEPNSAWVLWEYANFLLFYVGNYEAAIQYAEKSNNIMSFAMGRLNLACALFTKWAVMVDKHGEDSDQAEELFNKAKLLYRDMQRVLSRMSSSKHTIYSARKLADRLNNDLAVEINNKQRNFEKKPIQPHLNSPNLNGRVNGESSFSGPYEKIIEKKPNK